MKIEMRVLRANFSSDLFPTYLSLEIEPYDLSEVLLNLQCPYIR